MIQVSVRGGLPLTRGVANWVNGCQGRFVLETTDEDQQCVVQITEEPFHSLFRVITPRDVIVSSWQVNGLQHYASMRESEVIGLSSILGLIQLRALQLSEYLRVDDFIHPPRDRCLFSTLPQRHDFADVLDSIHVCRGCIDFYRCIGLEPEVEALLQALQSLHEARGLRRQNCT